MMGKFRVMLATIALASFAMIAVVTQAGGYYERTVTVAAGATSAGDWIDLSTTTIGCQAIDHAVVYHPSGAGSGTVYFASYDFGVTSNLFNSGVVIPLALRAVEPKRAYVTQKVEYVVTGNVAVATCSTYTNAEPHMLRLMRVNVTQVAQPAADVYKIGVYTREVVSDEKR